MSDMRKGILYMLLSAAGLSFFGLFAKLETESISFFLLTFLRFLVPLILIFPYIIWRVGIPRFSHLGSLKLQAGRIGCMLLYQYGIFYYLTQSSLFDAAVLQNTAPILIPVLERIFMGHPIKKGTMVGMIISFIGVLLILRPDNGIIGWVSLIGLISAVGQAGSQVFFGLQSRSEKGEANLFYLFFFSSIASLLIFLIIAPFQNGIDFEVHTLKQVDTAFYWCLLGLGVATISNQSFRGAAYKYARPGTLAPILYFTVIVSGLLDWAIFHHFPDIWTLLGGFLVILGGAIPFIRRKVKEHH
jgi:drug/metabolite transporter (DMT)-like permease